MKKIAYTLIGLLILGCNSSKQDEDYKETVETFENGNPKVVKEYPDKSNLDIYYYFDYYENGQISFTGYVEKGHFKGTKKAFYENGNPMEFCKLDDSCQTDFCCPDGFYESFYENGHLKETHYKKDGLFDGVVKTYDSLGLVRAEYEVSNDLKNGISKFYHEKGTVSSIKEYKNDTLIGRVYYFDEYGDSTKMHGTYKGNKDFPFKYWNDDRSSLYGEYYKGNNYQVIWIWRDSLNNITKTEVVDTINGQFITPDYKLQLPTKNIVYLADSARY